MQNVPVELPLLLKEQLEEGCGRHIFRESNAISYQIVAKLSRLMCRHVAQIAVHSTAISFEIELVYGIIKVLLKIRYERLKKYFLTH